MSGCVGVCGNKLLPLRRESERERGAVFLSWKGMVFWLDAFVVSSILFPNTPLTLNVSFVLVFEGTCGSFLYEASAPPVLLYDIWYEWSWSDCCSESMLVAHLYQQENHRGSAADASRD